ncbi:unnamed protein product, partial [Closterium sp. NIES-53]
MYGGWKKQPETKVSQQMEQITMQLDLTPSVLEKGEEAAAKGGDGEKVQEAPGGGGDDVETSGSTDHHLDIISSTSRCLLYLLSITTLCSCLLSLLPHTRSQVQLHGDLLHLLGHL